MRPSRTIVRVRRTNQGNVVDWLLPPVRAQVLTLMLTDPARRWHLRDIARRTGCAVGSVRRELTGLAACGVLVASREGNRTYYQADTRCPIYPELRGIVRKTTGLADVLRGALADLAHRIRVAFVYGSVARQEAGSGSDVDVMVVGDASFAETVGALGKAQDILGREVNPTVYSPQEFHDKLAAGHHFLRSVLLGPRIALIGDVDELAGVA